MFGMKQHFNLLQVRSANRKGRLRARNLHFLLRAFEGSASIGQLKKFDPQKAKKKINIFNINRISKVYCSLYEAF